MAEAVYVLCMLTSLACAALLWRGYRRSHARLLLWSSLCFAGLTVNNLFLILDMVVFPDVDLLPVRNISALLAMCLLIFGLIWETE